MGTIRAFLDFVGECTLLFLDVLRRLGSRPFELKELINQSAFVGFNSIPIVVLTTFFSGSVLALYGAKILVHYGATSLAGATVGLTVTREIAPVLAGIMVAARCGSAMAAQLGSMVVSEQVDALKSLNVAPTNYLVIPRVLSCVFGVPILCLIGCYAGILGGLLVCDTAGISQTTYMLSVKHFVQPWDFVGGLIKSLAFGLIISLVACQQGLRTSGGAVGVGRATTRTVVIAMVLIYAVNFVLASVLY